MSNYSQELIDFIDKHDNGIPVKCLLGGRPPWHRGKRGVARKDPHADWRKKLTNRQRRQYFKALCKGRLIRVQPERFWEYW